MNVTLNRMNLIKLIPEMNLRDHIKLDMSYIICSDKRAAGEKKDSNLQPLKPQFSALPLSYIHPHVICYTTYLKSILNCFLKRLYVVGPRLYFDLGVCNFLIASPELVLNTIVDPSSRTIGFMTRSNKARQMSPFLLNRTLNPLYSSRGGSTTRAEPLTKNPIVEDLRLKPLYMWNKRNQRTFVLSASESHDFLNSTS